MPSKAAKALIAKVEELGYRFDRRNSSARHVYVKDGFPDLPISMSIGDREARFLIKRLDRQHGIDADISKRNAQAVKGRQRAERERVKSEISRLDAERAALIERKEHLPAGDLGGLGRDERLAIERELARISTERQGYERLMTQLAAPLHNNAVHTAGSR